MAVKLNLDKFSVSATYIAGPTYSKLSDIRELICEKFNFRKLCVSATEIGIFKEN